MVINNEGFESVTFYPVDLDLFKLIKSKTSNLYFINNTSDIILELGEHISYNIKVLFKS